jgi:hypothetical protein
MNTPARPNIGITFFASQDPRHSIWSNGTLQNILLLLLLFRSSGQTGQVWLINGGDAETLPPWLRLAGLELDLVRFEQVASQLDILIEGGAQIEPEQEQCVHRNGGIVLAYRCGNDYVMDAERICFDLPPGPILNGTRFDEIWTQPQHEAMCRSFWEITSQAPVRVMPHIWSPLFIDLVSNNLKKTEPDAVFGYQPGTGGKRAAIFEPNLNIVKTFITPMLICEAAYRKHPDALSEVYVTNTTGLTEHPTFRSLISTMELWRDNVMSFEARYSLPLFLARFTDIVVSHQWDNGLNYLYYDVLYGGYPLIHNSPWLSDAGYYYPDFDAEKGAHALLQAIHHHDHDMEAYQQRSQHVLRRVDISNADNQRAHIDRLLFLLSQRRQHPPAA